MKRKDVVLTKETRQKEFVKKVMDTIAPLLSIQSSDKVAIKIDLSGSREIYANSHYETVESLIFYLKERFEIADISVIEGSDGAHFAGKTTWDIFYKFRYKEVELNGAKLVNLDDLPHEHTMEVQTLGGARQVRYTKIDADYIISVVPPKTHHIFPVTLSIPNIIGYVRQEDRAMVMGAPGSEMRKFNFPNPDRYVQLTDLAGKNLAGLLKELKPSLALIDGLYGMEGKGPIKGSPVFHGFAVASEDVVLADALTTYLMGFDVDQVAYISYAYQNGLGNNRWQNVIGVDPCHVKFPYRPHPLFQKQKLWRDNTQRRKGGASRDDRSHKTSRPGRYNKPGKPYKSYDRDRDRDRDHRDSRDTRDTRDTRDNRDHRDTRDSRENRDTREHREHRDNRRHRDSRENRDTRNHSHRERDNRDNRDNGARSARDNRDNGGIRDRNKYRDRNESNDRNKDGDNRPQNGRDNKEKD